MDELKGKFDGFESAQIEIICESVIEMKTRKEMHRLSVKPNLYGGTAD
jgi:hypothetical protein